MLWAPPIAADTPNQPVPHLCGAGFFLRGYAAGRGMPSVAGQNVERLQQGWKHD